MILQVISLPVNSSFARNLTDGQSIQFDAGGPYIPDFGICGAFAAAGLPFPGIGNCGN